MEKEEKIKISHEWLRKLKAINKLSNKEIASIIKYSDTGLRKALNNETLSYEQIELIAMHYNVLNELESNFNNYSGLKSSNIDLRNISSIGLHLKENHEYYMNTDPAYQMFIENIATKKALELVKGMISKS